jgi:hypothetical protein
LPSPITASAADEVRGGRNHRRLFQDHGVTKTAKPTVKRRRWLVRDLRVRRMGVRCREHDGVQHGREQSTADPEHGECLAPAE